MDVTVNGSLGGYLKIDHHMITDHALRQQGLY